MKGSVGRPSERTKVNHPEFAERLQRLMERQGISRRDMVRALDCTDAVFGNYYNGWRFPPPKYLGEIARTLGVTVGYLVVGDKREEPKEIEVTRPPTEVEILDFIMKKLRPSK
jgi:transcriptional regulator with XRE-family HTH domain